MVFNATVNNISVISWRSALLVDETGVLSLTKCIISCWIEYSSPSVGRFPLTSLVMLGTDCIGSCKLPYDHYHDDPRT
jgi:hypothetical protein